MGKKFVFVFIIMLLAFLVGCNVEYEKKYSICGYIVEFNEDGNLTFCGLTKNLSQTTDLYIPSSLYESVITRIAYNASATWAGASSIYIPSTVTVIERESFKDNSNDLEKIYWDRSGIIAETVNFLPGGVSLYTKNNGDYAYLVTGTTEMVFVEGGTVVGSSSYNMHVGVFPDGRTVTLNSFYMCVHEVTQKEYQLVMGSNPSQFNSNPSSGEKQEDRPVENVSWYDAIYYCNKKSIEKSLTPCYSVGGITNPSSWGYTPHNGNSINGAISCDFSANGYRLPTEAEWEFAARGGMETYNSQAFMDYFAGATTTNYLATSNSDLDAVGWYRYNICNGGVTGADASSNKSGYGTHEVKKKTANELGLYDMNGNVWEWCWDRYTDSFSSGSVNNPSGGISGTERIIRGGSWQDDATLFSISYRGHNSPNGFNSSRGFRVVRTAE